MNSIALRKKLLLTGFLSLIGLTSTPTAMADITNNPYQDQNSSSNQDTSSGAGSSMQAIASYIMNLGGYLGYPVETTPAAVSSTLLNEPYISNLQKESALLLLGTIPVLLSTSTSSSSTSTDPTIVASTNPNATEINKHINMIFKSQTDTQEQSAHLVKSKYIDQKLENVEQNTIDPISQNIVNRLTTDTFGACGKALTSTATQPISTEEQENCIKRNSDAIATHVLGGVPNPQKLPKLNTNLINQMNSNSLIAPMLYSTTSSTATAKQTHLTATNQVQEAENFIRYASFELAPLPQISYKNYESLYVEATDTSQPAEIQAEKMASLSNYFVTLRSLAAQQSVAISNLYSILSKRMPQTDASTGNSTSEALNEYVMASKRLYDTNPGKDGQESQWVKNINTASSATVQKEMAVLLAEINYQLYLNRQQQERMLLTDSILIIQISHALQMETRIPKPSGTGQNPSSGE